MNKTEAKNRIEKLRVLINKHRYFYHVLDEAKISSEALDSLKKELFDLEMEFPELISADSPTQRIGGEPLKFFKKTEHPAPMLSFNDAFNEKDLNDWLERIKKLLNPSDWKKIDFFCELKFDGLAIELIYEKGLLKIGSTRGNGLIGEDVTQNLKTIESIPLKIKETEEILEDFKKEGMIDCCKKFKDLKETRIVVRGEALITKKDFERINKEREKEGLVFYSNPRNIAAGSIRQLDPQITASRKLDFYGYDIIGDFGQKNHEQEHKILKILGFKTHPNNKCCKDLKEVFAFREFWSKKRNELPFEIDGIVATVNDNEIFERLGIVGKAPRGAIAYKFPLKQATTKIKDIIVQLGRTGAITPVAILEPVQISGVTISRATLHNEDEIKKLGVKIKDTVIVGRAGDVIPQIVEALKELRTGKEIDFKMPKFCPSCNGKLKKKENEVVWRCPNKNCFEIKKKEFHHFVSRKAFDMRGIGPKILDKLLEENLINDPADLFQLKEGDLIPLERFGKKSAENVINSINGKRKISLERLIYSLGIRNVGEETALVLSSIYGGLNRIKSASKQELEEIHDIGPVVAESIYSWFKDDKNIKFLNKLLKEIEIKKTEKRNNFLSGKTFILTGTLTAMSREEAKNKIRRLGGKISSNVSQNIDFVIAGENPGSKFERAKQLGIKILNEKQFLEIFKRL
ncbi:MAG: NAD-dependent DNA ligase LigA [bacterium]|nr:NAD-dependent DNA ligase LigA [bacterium]